ncbi:MAG: proton-conducting transporter membrane subunit, partial [Planctomycetaceae bacterium]
YAGIHSAVASNGLANQPMLLAAVGLLLAGLAFKIAAFPFHAWAPDAYQGAGTPVAAFLATASKAAGLAALGRVCLVALETDGPVVSGLLMVVAALSILVGSIITVAQTDMKRLLAYSSISHAGYALLGFVAATSDSATPALAADGAAASMAYAFLYVFMTLGMFGILIGLGQRGASLDDYQGLAAQRPGVAALMLLFLLSLAGIPPTAGFTAKFGVLLAVVRAGYWGLAILAVICSVITAFVYLRVAVLMYMKEPEKSVPARFTWAVSSALAVAALVTMIGGIFPAATLMDGIFPDFVPVWAISPGN